MSLTENVQSLELLVFTGGPDLIAYKKHAKGSGKFLLLPHKVFTYVIGIFLALN